MVDSPDTFIWIFGVLLLAKIFMQNKIKELEKMFHFFKFDSLSFKRRGKFSRKNLIGKIFKKKNINW